VGSLARWTKGRPDLECGSLLPLCVAASLLAARGACAAPPKQASAKKSGSKLPHSKGAHEGHSLCDGGERRKAFCQNRPR
jgi:hypothetical protein